MNIMFDLYEKGNLNLLKPLVQASKDKNPQDPKEWNKETLLHKAGNQNLEIVQFLVPLLSDKNPKNNVGWTPLHTAALNGKTEVVKHSVSVDKHSKDEFGDTPLDKARRYGYTEIVNILEKYPK